MAFQHFVPFPDFALSSETKFCTFPNFIRIEIKFSFCLLLPRYPDEYVLEDLELSVADFVQRAMKSNFPAAWEELGAENELEDTYALGEMKTLEEAVKNIVAFLGMQPCERSDKVPEGKSSHTLVLAGEYSAGFLRVFFLVLVNRIGIRISSESVLSDEIR